MKKNKKQKFIRITAIILALLMVVPMLISAFATVAYGADITYVDDTGKKYTLTDFRDTQGHWAQRQIKAWANYQIINGYNGNFMPDNAISRCDLACIIDRLMGLTYTSYNSFRDLQSGQYYTDSMLKCYAAGYIQGDGKDLRPLDTATREEVATILFRVFNMEEESSKSKFNDSSSISSWASTEVATMASKGFINGYPDGSFGPQNNITRAEFMTMLDNIVAVYITSNVKTSDTITNHWEGNAVINKRGMTLARSSISENLYCTQSCTNIILQDTKVDGTLYCFSDSFNLDLRNSSVNTVYTNSVATIKGVENIETLIVSYEGSGTIITEMPSTLILEAGASVLIGKATYVNDSSKSKTYDSEEIYADIAKDGYTLANSPSIHIDKISISADNIVSFQGLRPGQRGTGELKSFGILMMEGTNVPTIDDYDDKLSYRSSYLDEYYREQGGTRGRISEEIGKVEDGETYTYVPYAINYGGMVAYGEPIVLKSYQFEYSMSLLDTGEYPKSVQVLLTLEGENIPKVSNVTCYYDVTPAYVSDRNSKNMALLRVTDKDTRYEDDSDNERILYSVILSEYTHKQTKETVIPTYFGYQISFSDGSVYSEFPFLMNAVPDALSPISSITTGGTSTSGDIVTITDNKIESLNTVINQYGVVYCYGNTPSSDFFDDSWAFMAEGTSIGFNTERTYSVKLNKDGNKRINYAAYVKTVEGYYFGSVKTYDVEDAGTMASSTSVEAIVLPNEDYLLFIKSSFNVIDILASKICEVYDSNGNIVSSLNNMPFIDCLVTNSSNKMYGSYVYLTLDKDTDLSGIKLQCATLGHKADAYSTDFENILNLVPSMSFSNESDGLFTYNFIVDDIDKEVLSDLNVTFKDSSLVFDKSTFTVTSPVDLRNSSVEALITLTFNSFEAKHEQTYITTISVE